MAIRVQAYDSGLRRIQAGPIDPGVPRGAIRDVRGTAQDSFLADVLAAGKQLTGIAIQEYVKDETTRVSQSLLGMQQELNAERDRYMAENKGQDALGAGQHFADFARKTAQKYLQEGGFSGRFADTFKERAAGAMLHFGEQGVAYARQERATWDKSVFDSSVVTAEQAVASNWSNTDYAEFQRQGLHDQIDAMFPGKDNRVRKIAVDRKLAQARMDGAISSGNWDAAESMLGMGSGGAASSGKVALSADVDAIVEKVAREEGVAPDLIAAVIMQESGGRQDVVSRAGATGLMQLMPGTAKELGVDPNDPEANVRGGTRYLKQMLQRYGGNVERALMAYNWGPANVDEYFKTGKGLGGQARPKESLDYVPSVMGRLQGRGAGSGGTGSGIQGLDPADRLAYMRMITAERNRQEANVNKQAREILDKQKDAVYAAQFMGDVKPLIRMASQLRALGKGTEAAELETAADFWQRNQAAADFASNASFPDVAARIGQLQRELTPKDGKAPSLSIKGHKARAGELEAMTRIYSARLSGLKKDPAQAAQENLDRQGLLPSESTPGDRAQARIAYQQRNGIPVVAQRVLTKVEAADMAQKWQSAPAEPRFSMVTEISRAYGDLSPRVLSEMGLSTPEIDAALSIGDDPRNALNAREVFAVSAMDAKELPKLEDKSALQAVLDGSEMYRAMLRRASMLQSPEAWKTATQYRETAEKLLRAGRDPDKVTAILSSGRSVLDDDNVSVILPASYGLGITSEDVQMAFLERLPEVVGASMISTGNAGTDKILRDREVVRLRQVGMVVNSPDGKGFVVLDGTTGSIYRGVGGKDFTFTLEDVKQTRARLEQADNYIP